MNKEVGTDRTNENPILHMLIMIMMTLASKKHCILTFFKFPIQLSFFYSPDPPTTRSGLPTATSNRETPPTDTAMGSSDRGNSSGEVPSSQTCQVDHQE